MEHVEIEIMTEAEQAEKKRVQEGLQSFDDTAQATNAAILKLAAGGNTTEEIAAKLNINRRTIDKRFHNLFDRTGTSNKTHLIHLLTKYKLLA